MNGDLRNNLNVLPRGPKRRYWALLAGMIGIVLWLGLLWLGSALAAILGRSDVR